MMKKIVLGLAAVAAATFMSFKGADVTYKADATKTDLAWNAKKVTGAHAGKVTLKSGSLVMDGTTLKSGVIEIDMNTITCTDLQGEYADKLVGHLKSDDFFGVANFATSTLKITGTKSTGKDTYDVMADVTIKGKTEKITFPATIKSDAKGVTATAKITLDRTKFDVKYGSGKFFEGLGDKMIYDEFTIDVNLFASK
jgi:polyisoprenoid-binding protein YceI